MDYGIGDKVYVKLSDAPEFRGEITDITETHFYILTRENKSLWVEKRRCSWRSRER